MADQNIAIPSQGTTFEIEDASTPGTWYEIKGRKSFQLQEADPVENDETVLTSTAREYSVGLPGDDVFSETVQYNLDDAGQNQLRAAQAASELRNFRLTLANGKVGTFSGFVRGFSMSGAVNQSLEGNYSVKISGGKTWT